jgi:YHS domain-containing protein
MASQWRSRLEALAQRFGERVKVEPEITPSRRQATLAFQSNVARIQLRFAVFPDEEVRQVFFTYDLDIIPILMQFDAHDRIAFPLEAIDRTALGAWLDDRILSFVRTYLQVHQDQSCQKEHLVEDPIAGIRFPKYAAAATMEWKGKPVYFISEETRKEFERKQAAARG